MLTNIKCMHVNFFSCGRIYYCNVFIACVVEYIITITKEITVVEEMIKLSSFMDVIKIG